MSFSRVCRVGLLLAMLLAVPATVLGASVSVTVLNSPPTVTSAALPTATVLPTSGANTNVAATIVVTDLNGCNDLSSVQVEVLTPAGVSHVAQAAATYVSCAGGTAATYRYVFPMRFYDAPAALESGYKLRVTAIDSQGETVTNDASILLFGYAELAALQLDRSTFDFGTSLSPGAQSDVLPLAVQNAGNVRVDTAVSGTDLTHESEEATIGVGNMRHATASDMSASSAASTTSATMTGFDLASGASSARSLYWQLTVPSGEQQWVPSGAYTGTLTVSAVKG